MLKAANYDKEKTIFLTEGFREGFIIGYEGPENVKQLSPNLKFHTGNETILWNKVMKEVKAKRYAGPFDEIPYPNYIQSPIGLVPKDGGKDTRLIFHLSYPRNGKRQSVNANTPQELCKVTYAGLDLAVKRCMEEGVGCHMSKSDFSQAFRNLGIKKKHWKFLIMKARNPEDAEKKWKYFVDKCLPFGASISCAIFQAFSDAIAFIMK